MDSQCYVDCDIAIYTNSAKIFTRCVRVLSEATLTDIKSYEIVLGISKLLYKDYVDIGKSLFHNTDCNLELHKNKAQGKIRVTIQGLRLVLY